VQRVEKPRQCHGLKPMRLRSVRSLAIEPGDDAPAPWIPTCGEAESNRRGYLQRQMMLQYWQPTLFIFDEARGE
jgi:hypothetical protein